MSNDTHISQPLLPGGAQRGYNMLSSAPGPLVRAGDFLRLNATTTDTVGVLQLNGRLLTLDGEVVPFALSLTFSGTGNQTSTTVPLADGWIIGFDVFVSSGTITDGEVQASVEVVQGSGSGLTRVMCLASGEVTNIRGLGLGAWNGFRAVPVLQTASSSDPAAGAEISHTIPAGPRWILSGMRFTLVTSATAGSRVPSMTITRGGTELYRFGAGSAQNPSVTGQWQFANLGASTSISSTSLTALIPMLPPLDVGDVIATVTANLAAGDDYSAAVYTFQPA